ncbi:MAG: hypothetical protein IT555_14440 [Acetobacteraceae bacterium]|nr:hypothetical protein [Acetobacteraceae bacterium]
MKTLLFVNKKKQKNFTHSAVAEAACAMPTQGTTTQRIKFFCFFLFTKRSLVFLLLLALALPACGRKGPPNPPGPADKITFPRSYPAR